MDAALVDARARRSPLRTRSDRVGTPARPRRPAWAPRRPRPRV